MKRVLLAGLCTVDVVQRVTELPGPGEKVQSLAVDVAAGGPATNAAVTVAALGDSATLLTVLGGHPLAALARADLETHGVRVIDLAPERTESPAVSAVAVRDRDGERTVVSRNAAGSSVTWTGEIDADAVLVDGHHPDVALAVARAAKAAGVPVVLDAGSWKPVLDELLPLVDVAACSAHFVGPGPGLHERGVPVVITTAGPKPVRWSTVDGERGEVPVPPVAARDTLGAGDVWHGALAHAVAAGVVIRGFAPAGGSATRTPESRSVIRGFAPAGGSATRTPESRSPGKVPEWIEYANRVAAERVRHVGPRSWTGLVGPAGEEVR